jgi:RNA:NAD 2'-phosphotransferase (TPT1/KptA family)
MEYLYHATPVENVTSILADGIRPGRSGEVHLANRPEWAAGFVEPHVDSEVFVFAVNVDEIDMELLEVSYTADTHIKARSLNLPPELVVHAYEGTIGACALVPLGVVEFGVTTA